MSEGRVGGEGFAIDASVIKADASSLQHADGSRETLTGRRRAAFGAGDQPCGLFAAQHHRQRARHAHGLHLCNQLGARV
jgi:hypothetical protein